jgi:hypothetical protein
MRREIRSANRTGKWDLLPMASPPQIIVPRKVKGLVPEVREQALEASTVSG